MFYLAYNLLSILLLPLVLLFTVCRSLSLRWPLDLPARFGLVPATGRAAIAGRPVILIHAVSVGEVIAARPLIRGLRERYPRHALVVSSSTDTGRETARGVQGVDLSVCFPFDFIFAIRQMLNLLRPSLVVVMETEIWPNFTRETSRRGIPLVLANGRISDRSFPRYRACSWFFRQPLQHFSHCCMQSETARERIIAIGAAAERVTVTGNLKYDIPARRLAQDARMALRRRFAVPGSALVLVAGSTHDNEEEMIATICRELAADMPDLLLILAPRHPQRSGDVAALLRRLGIACRHFSEFGESPEVLAAGEVLLMDRVGELLNLYALADLAFVGGSLVTVGGHNLLEPASQGVPVLYGPHMANFREVEDLVASCGCGVRIEAAGELCHAVRRLAGDPDERHRLGDNGLAMVRENGGATARHLDIIGTYLTSR